MSNAQVHEEGVTSRVHGRHEDLTNLPGFGFYTTYTVIPMFPMTAGFMLAENKDRKHPVHRYFIGKNDFMKRNNFTVYMDRQSFSKLLAHFDWSNVKYIDKIHIVCC